MCKMSNNQTNNNKNAKQEWAKWVIKMCQTNN